MVEAQLAMTQGDLPTDGLANHDTSSLDANMMNDVLMGRTQLKISHGGGEYVEVMMKLRSLLKEKRFVIFLVFWGHVFSMSIGANVILGQEKTEHTFVIKALTLRCPPLLMLSWSGT